MYLFKNLIKVSNNIKFPYFVFFIENALRFFFPKFRNIMGRCDRHWHERKKREIILLVKEVLYYGIILLLRK